MNTYFEKTLPIDVLTSHVPSASSFATDCKTGWGAGAVAG